MAALWQRSLVSSQGDDQGKRERGLARCSITSHSESKISHRGTYVAALCKIYDALKQESDRHAAAIENKHRLRRP